MEKHHQSSSLRGSAPGRKRLLSLVVLLCISLTAFAQTAGNVTISAKNEPVKSVLAQIEKQTGCTFSYPANLIDESKKVSLDVKDKSLSETLDLLFSKLGINYELNGNKVVLTGNKAAGIGKRKVTGTVKDETGQLFPFVDVFITNTTLGTVTDSKGHYELTVEGDVSLTFNFLGYAQQDIPVGKRTVIDVTLRPEANVMEESVIVAFGEQRKAAMSAAVSTVKSEEIMKSPVSNISNAVAGRIPGLISMQGSGQPGADESTLYIRGAGTWNDAEPLYVIDGVERNQAQFLRIDPSEIESFSILKDAAATAVYGSKGANGVVLVTTKRGEEGRPAVNFTSSVTMNQPTRYPNYLNSYESLKLYNEALMNDGQDPLYTEADLEHYRLQDDPYRYPDTDWYSIMMKDFSMQTNNSLSVRGGTKSVKYYLSGTYMYQDGQLKTSQGRIYDPKFGYQRYTFRSNVDILLTKAFTISFDMSGGMTDKAQPYENTDVFQNMNRIPSWVMPATNPDGSFAGTVDFPSANPMYLLNTRGTYRAKNNTVNTSIKLSYDFSQWVKGLKLSARAAYDSNFGNYGQWTETQSTFELISQAGRTDRYRDYLEPKFYSTSSGSISSTRKIYGEANLSWKGQIKSHNLNASAIANVSDYRTGTSVPYRSVSFIGRFNWSFKDRYFLEANAAYRGSENFAPGRRFGLFPSVSVGWNLHNEQFMKNNVRFIDNFKIRASYGKTGNDYANVRFIFKEGKWTTGTDSYAYFGVGGGISQGYSTEPVIANPYATWESAYQTNVGVDLSFLKKKFTLSVDRFYERREDILMTPNSIPGIIGIGVTDMNIGKTKKNGWEFDAGFTQKIAKDLTLFLKANYTYVYNEVVFKDEADDMIAWQKEEGLPIGQYFGYQVLGFFRDQEDIDNSPKQEVGTTPIPGDLKYLDYNGDGVINTYDRIPIGYPKIPQITYGLSAGLDYKGFSLDVHFQGAANSSVFISNYLMYEFYNRGRVQDIHLGRWTPETADTATYPALHIGATSQNHNRNTFFQKNNPYLRLKNVELAYRFKFKKDAAIKSLRIHASGVNLFTWDKLQVVDPETPTGSTGGVYPQTKGYSFGVNMSF